MTATAESQVFAPASVVEEVAALRKQSGNRSVSSRSGGEGEGGRLGLRQERWHG